MGWKASCNLCRLAGLAILLAWGCAPALAIVDQDTLRCSANVSVAPVLRSDVASEFLANINLNCTGGPTSSPGTSNMTLLVDGNLANTGATGMPLLTVSYDQCSHLGNSILCPPGVTAGSNSLFFDGSGNIVFPGPVTVAPGNIFPYTPPSSFFGTVNANTVVWPGIPIDTQNKGARVFRITNVRNTATLPSPTSNLPIFGSLSASGNNLSFTFPTSLVPGTNKLLMGVAMPSTSSNDGFCESPLVMGNGITPFVLIRQATVGSTNYDAILTLSGTLTTLDLYAYTPSTPGSCRGNSIFNPGNGALDLQNVFYQGQDFWGQANQSGNSFINLRYGSGTMPPR